MNGNNDGWGLPSNQHNAQTQSNALVGVRASPCLIQGQKPLTIIQSTELAGVKQLTKNTTSIRLFHQSFVSERGELDPSSSHQTRQPCFKMIPAHVTILRAIKRLEARGSGRYATDRRIREVTKELGHYLEEVRRRVNELEKAGFIESVFYGRGFGQLKVRRLTEKGRDAVS